MKTKIYLGLLIVLCVVAVFAGEQSGTNGKAVNIPASQADAGSIVVTCVENCSYSKGRTALSNSLGIMRTQRSVDGGVHWATIPDDSTKEQLDRIEAKLDQLLQQTDSTNPK
jgi:hypothetical protein